MSGYAWIVYWICLNMPEYTRISVNIFKSVRAPFVSHAPIVIPCLLKRVVTHFDEVYSLKEHEAVSWRDKFWFFLYRPVEEGGDCRIVANSETAAILKSLQVLFSGLTWWSDWKVGETRFFCAEIGSISPRNCPKSISTESLVVESWMTPESYHKN